MGSGEMRLAEGRVLWPFVLGCKLKDAAAAAAGVPTMSTPDEEEDQDDV